LPKPRRALACCAGAPMRAFPTSSLRPSPAAPKRRPSMCFPRPLCVARVVSGLPTPWLAPPHLRAGLRSSILRYGRHPGLRPGVSVTFGVLPGLSALARLLPPPKRIRGLCRCKPCRRVWPGVAGATACAVAPSCQAARRHPAGKARKGLSPLPVPLRRGRALAPPGLSALRADLMLPRDLSRVKEPCRQALHP